MACRSEAFQQHRHDPAIRHGSGTSMSTLFWEKTGETEQTVTTDMAEPDARAE
jgi:hypothetical protein